MRRTGKNLARGVSPASRVTPNKGHLARAVLEATAFQTREVVEAMEKDRKIPLVSLRVDGGMVANETFNAVSERHSQPRSGARDGAETTALGAAIRARLAVGFIKGCGRASGQLESRQDLRNLRLAEHETRKAFAPGVEKGCHRSFDWVQD